MTAKPYVPVTWGDEPVFTDKLNQMTNNDQYLFENSPRMYYNGYGVKKTTGIKILAGLTSVGSTKVSVRSATINFGTFFSSGSRPIVVVGMNPLGGGAGYSPTLRGVDGKYIDYRGFRCAVYTTNAVKDAYGLYINWIAIGW